MSAPGFRTGAAEAEKAGQRSSFHRTEYLTIEDGKYVNLRMLTDAAGWIIVDQHNQIPTRPAPEGQGDKWPAKMAGVCRNDQGVKGMYPDCFICEHVLIEGKPPKKQQRTWGLAVLRKEVYDNGRMVGLEDETEEIDGPDGSKKTVPKIVVINQSWNLFWSKFDGHAQMYGTLLDRDYRVTRKGKELNTDYTVGVFDPIMLPDGNGGTERLDLRDEKHMAKYADAMPDLVKIIVERTSDDFYATFFDTRVPQPKREGAADATPAGGPAPAAPQNDAPSAAELAALAQRAEGYGPSPAQQPAQTISLNG